MAIRQIFKVSRKTFFHPSAWIDADGLKRYNYIIWDNLKRLFTRQQPEREETFEEAVQRQGLTEADIQAAERSYQLFAYGFLGLGLVVFIFGFYLLLSYLTFHGWLIAMGAAAICFAQAFRYHFWFFQIKHRKLGCTFEEWRQGKPYDKDAAP